MIDLSHPSKDANIEAIVAEPGPRDGLALVGAGAL